MTLAKTALPLLLLTLLLPARRAAAQTCEQDFTWQEQRTASFSIVYPAEHPAVGQMIAQQLGGQLDREYARFAQWFQTSLDLPLTIRIYPGEPDYYCLNTLAPQIPYGATHSHIGTREIALIGNNIAAEPEQWQAAGLNTLRYELGSLFAQHITEGKAPPGLKIGIGLYTEEPAVMWAQQAEDGAPEGQPAATWRALWESPDIVHRPTEPRQLASIVAYLVDVYGWETFLHFLRALPTAENYRQALQDTYGVEPGPLQTHWRVYYPVYFEGRWRAHVLYGFDLTVFEQLIAAGAFADAAAGLKEALAFFVKMGQTDQVLAAEALNSQALAGVEANALVRQARQALLESDYPATLEFAAGAKEKYTHLGYTARDEELTAYAARAQEILALRAELAEMQTQIGPENGLEYAPRLTEIGVRLGELGDTEGQAAVRVNLQQLTVQRANYATTVSMFVVLLCLSLLVHRAYHVWTQPPPETL